MMNCFLHQHLKQEGNKKNYITPDCKKGVTYFWIGVGEHVDVWRQLLVALEGYRTLSW
jgi:hypothetical protein